MLARVVVALLLSACAPALAAVGYDCPSIKKLFKEDNECCSEPDKALAPVHEMESTIIVMFDTYVRNREIADALIDTPETGLKDFWAATQYAPHGQGTIAYTTDPDCDLCELKGTVIHMFNSLERMKAWLSVFENIPTENMEAICTAFHWPEIRVIGPGVDSQEFKTFWFHTLRNWRPVCPLGTHPAIHQGSGSSVFLGTATGQTVLPPNMY